MAAPPPPYPQTSDLQFSALMAAIEGVKVAHASQHEHLAAQVQELSNNVDNKIQQVDKKVEDVANKFDAMDERVAILEEFAKKPPAAPSWPAGSSGSHPLAQGSGGTLPVEGFDRAHRPNVISCNAHDNVQFTKTTATEFFNQMLADKGLKVDFVVDGKYEMGKKFPVTFSGPGTVPLEQCLAH